MCVFDLHKSIQSILILLLLVDEGVDAFHRVLVFIQLSSCFCYKKKVTEENCDVNYFWFLQSFSCPFGVPFQQFFKNTIWALALSPLSRNV